MQQPALNPVTFKIHPNNRTETIGGWAEDGQWKKCLLAAYRFAPGKRFVFESTGGGWGNPLDREMEKVLDDVLDEYVTIETAREVYGVVIDPKSLTLNSQATVLLRGQMRQANGNGTFVTPNEKISISPRGYVPSAAK